MKLECLIVLYIRNILITIIQKPASHVTSSTTAIITLWFVYFCYAFKSQLSHLKVKTSLKKTAANAASAPSTDGTPALRPSRITKPPVPKQMPLPKKPPVPRAPRSARIPNAPLPDLKNVSSKIGSTDNMKYQPGGGKVQWFRRKILHCVTAFLWLLNFSRLTLIVRKTLDI